SRLPSRERTGKYPPAGVPLYKARYATTESGLSDVVDDSVLATFAISTNLREKAGAENAQVCFNWDQSRSDFTIRQQASRRRRQASRSRPRGLRRPGGDGDSGRPAAHVAIVVRRPHGQ